MSPVEGGGRVEIDRLAISPIRERVAGFSSSNVVSVQVAGPRSVGSGIPFLGGESWER